MSFKILLVDDEPDILEIISYNLKKEGYKIHTAENGKVALQKALKIKPDLILLDLMLPEMDGVEVCEKIRNTKTLHNTLITFLTARAEDYSVLAGLSAGADDYITKPIKPKILVKKVKSILRRLSLKNQKLSILKIRDLQINTENYIVLKNEKEVFLTRREFELLVLLAQNPDKIFTREEILDEIWGTEVFVGSRTIDVHIRKLREKIGENYFKTIKRIGYRFIVVTK